VATLVAAAALIAASPAAADPTFGVMNAPEGVYWRSEPNWAAAERVSGFGVYNGTVIAVHCYQSGTAVEGSADTMWEQATDVAGPGYGSGWVNEHFINDGQPINQPSPGVPPCNAPPPPPPPPSLVFSVFNAEGGIYYRSSPHWADTPAIPGVGVYDGDQVQLICGAFGDPVGPYNDTAWSYVNNLSRPVGYGWVNEHFINDGQLTNQFVGGEPMCGPETPGIAGGASGGGSSGGSGGPSPGGPTPPSHAATSVFYSPLAPTGGLAGLNVADDQLTVSAWATGTCSTGPAASLERVPSSVNTLSGWSKGRLGPMYFLESAGQSRVANVHYIVLFDPGSFDEMSGCDGGLRPESINTLLAEWLHENRNNRLLVLTGHDSEEHQFGRIGRSFYHGLWHYYFAGIWNKHFANQALVCDYNNLGHPDVLKDFYGVVRYPPSGCPVSPSAPRPVAWHP
jgi:hypothetical protein